MLLETFLDRYRLAAVIQAIEDDLRSFIRRHVAPNVEAETAIPERLETLRGRARADGIVDASFELLIDYFDFGDAFALLNRYRGLLPEAVGQAIRSLTPAFEVAVPIRNAVMHGRPLRPSDEEQVARLGQAVAGIEVPFSLTRNIVARLVEDPAWAPLIDIETTGYGNALHNLPLPEFDETGLLGRDAELKQTRDLLTKRRFPVVTIAGEGGIGKTALAVQVLYDLVDLADPPFDVVLWASLKTERLTGRGIEQIRDVGLDLLSLTSALGGALGGGAQADTELLAQVLDGTRALVAIDNVESMGPSEIRNLIDALPDAQFLLTSRVGLGEIEWRIPLGALSSAAAKPMLRQLAARRALPQIARMSDKQAEQVVSRLRGSPLAIRWFVEAVHAGGQPDVLLRDQSAVLQFCMSSIYDSLDSAGKRLVECFVALDTNASVGQLALLTELDRDEVQEQIYELQRRAIVQVDSRLSETLSQSYALGAMPREYLARFGSLDRAFGERVRQELRDIEATDEMMRQLDRRLALEPSALSVETPEEKAVANVLRSALRKSKRGDIDQARSEIARARDAVPAYFETYRVEAFIESSSRPEEARRLYQEAYRLAPDESKPRVAYWMASHLLSLMAAKEAESYALEAHEALGLPGTALALARVCMYEGLRFEQAETLLLEAAEAENARTRVIAEMLLLDLAKRRSEQIADEDKQPLAALDVAIDAIGRAETFLATGVVDARYEESLGKLVSESLLVALRLPDVSVAEEQISAVLEALDRNFRVLARSGVREEWFARLKRLCASSTCPPDVISYAEKLETRLETRLVLQRRGRARGLVLEYSAKKAFGFIQAFEGGENHFFHRSGLHDEQDAVFLTRGAEVEFRPTQQIDDGRERVRAEDVTVVLTEVERQHALRGRSAVVVSKVQRYLFAEDRSNHVRYYVDRSAFQDPNLWASVEVGTQVRLDAEIGPQGLRAVSARATGTVGASL
jgi:cold shock CspA family protein/Flp pilus assembly protein TadD